MGVSALLLSFAEAATGEPSAAVTAAVTELQWTPLLHGLPSRPQSHNPPEVPHSFTNPRGIFLHLCHILQAMALRVRVGTRATAKPRASPPLTEQAPEDTPLQAGIDSCHRVAVRSRLKTHVGGSEHSQVSNSGFGSFLKYKHRKTQVT